MDGRAVHFGSPREAIDSGIATVFQDLATIPLISIARNFFMGREPTTGWGPLRRLRWQFINDTVRAELSKVGIDVRDPAQAVGTLSGGVAHVDADLAQLGANRVVYELPAQAA